MTTLSTPPLAQNLAPKYLLINITGLTFINPRQTPHMSDKDDAYATIFQRTQKPFAGREVDWQT